MILVSTGWDSIGSCGICYADTGAEALRILICKQYVIEPAEF
jgi:hypothetical protein